MAHKSYSSGRREPFTFDFDGQPVPPFKSRGGLGSIVLELSELAALRDLEAVSPEGMAAIVKVFQMLLGPTEYERFRTFVAENDVDPEVMVDVLGDMFVAVVGHPLAPSESSTGPSETPHMLRVISSSGVQDVPLTPEREAELIAEMEAGLSPGTTPGTG
jgi:hypothetical protein